MSGRIAVLVALLAGVAWSAEGGALRVPKVENLRLDGGVEDWASIPRRELKAGELDVARVTAAHDGANLYLLYEVQDNSPLKNAGMDANTLFKQGDVVDLMLGPTPAHGAPGAGDLRLLFAPTDPTSILLYRQVSPDTPPEERVPFISPVRRVDFDSVQPFDGAEIVFKPAEGGYVAEARVSLEKLGFRYQPGLRLRGDVGVLSSNEGGMLTERRLYLFNPQTNVVADLPSEAELMPGNWGEWILE